MSTQGTLRRVNRWYQGEVTPSGQPATASYLQRSNGSSHGVRQRVRRASHSRVVRSLARAGLIASGVVHVLIGVLGMSVANGIRVRADQSGALEAVADAPGGYILLWVATVALLGLGLWQWSGALTAGPDESKIFPRKLRDHAKALGFVGVGLACLAFAVGSRPDAAEGAKTLSSTLISMPGGVFVLAAIGAVVGGVGIAFISRGVSRRFREDIDPPEGPWGRVVVAIGIIGHTMKGIALVTVGLLFVGGAVFTDADWTTGLDGAIRWLAALPTGPWPLFAISAGFMIHGLYLAARAVYLKR